MENDTNDKLIFALEQKKLLLTKIADLTKQIEVRSKQKEIQLENLPAQRQILLDRVEKCNHMADRCIASLSGERQEKMKRILSGQALPEECSPAEAKLRQDSLDCLALLRTILAENTVAVNRIRTERNRIQAHLSSLRREGISTHDMFHSL